MIELAFSSQDHCDQNWVWFPGWGFKAEVFTQLAIQLPGRHYWYRWDDECHFAQAVDCASAQLPTKAILIGWSLGGALATAIAHKHVPISALITLSTPAKFCHSQNYPLGMPRDVFTGFLTSYANNPRKTLLQFLLLITQGCKHPKNLIRALGNDQLAPSASLQQQLLWLDQYDFSESLLNHTKFLHMFADNDALVSSPTDTCVKNACHAFFMQHPTVTLNKIRCFYEQLS